MNPQRGRTLLELIDPWELEGELERGEREIVRELEGSSAFIPTKVEVIDYLVDQLRFVKAAWAQAEGRGLRGLPALEWVEYLSWPECLRQAKAGWQRELLRRVAFETPRTLWQRALCARRPEQAAEGFVGFGLPRGALTPPPMLQLGPYPSGRQPTRQAPAGLQASLYIDPGGEPGPLRPVRRLEGEWSWEFRAWAARLYNGQSRHVQVLIDEPRTYAVEEALAVLLAQAERWKAVRQAAAHTASVQASPEMIAQWETLVAVLEGASEALRTAGTRERGTLLNHLFTLPGTLWVTAAEVLTDDLPPEWLGVFLGFAFERQGMLSVRECKQLQQAAGLVLSHWQATRYPEREVGPEGAARLIRRLAAVQRPLQPKSVFAYLAKLMRGAPGRI